MPPNSPGPSAALGSLAQQGEHKRPQGRESFTLSMPEREMENEMLLATVKQNYWSVKAYPMLGNIEIVALSIL